jgi:hypothetical protein
MIGFGIRNFKLWVIPPERIRNNLIFFFIASNLPLIAIPPNP